MTVDSRPWNPITPQSTEHFHPGFPLFALLQICKAESRNQIKEINEKLEKKKTKKKKKKKKKKKEEEKKKKKKKK